MGWQRHKKDRGGGGGKNWRRAGKAKTKAKSFVVDGEEEYSKAVKDGPSPISLSQLTGEQRDAADRALRGESLFLTGAAGTGKSFLLRFIIQELEKKHSKKIAVTAPTGIAATHVGGQTIHSFSGVGLGTGSPRKLLNKVRKSAAATGRWQKHEVLIIDEISMLSADLFEGLEVIASNVRTAEAGGQRRPFGGMQIILCGDFLQLPPVPEKGMARSFCFQAKAWSRCCLDRGTVVLREAVRQSGDADFARILNEVRLGVVSELAEEMLEKCHVSLKPPPRDGIVPTRLYCHNKNVDAENQKQLTKLPGAVKVFTARDFFKGARGAQAREHLQEQIERKMSSELKLKIGAQVIHTKNNPTLRLVNGSRGVVESFSDGFPVVRFDSRLSVRIGQETTTHGTSSHSIARAQVPLKLGWALTVHKSQGMTLTRAELQLDNVFEAGQAYVALSRLTGRDGLWISGDGLCQSTTRADEDVLDFYSKISTPSQQGSLMKCFQVQERASSQLHGSQSQHTPWQLTPEENQTTPGKRKATNPQKTAAQPKKKQRKTVNTVPTQDQVPNFASQVNGVLPNPIPGPFSASAPGGPQKSTEEIMVQVQHNQNIIDNIGSSGPTVHGALQELRNMGSMPTEVLKQTLIGRSVANFIKRGAAPSRCAVAAVICARDLLAEWKADHRRQKNQPQYSANNGTLSAACPQTFAPQFQAPCDEPSQHAATSPAFYPNELHGSQWGMPGAPQFQQTSGLMLGPHGAAPGALGSTTNGAWQSGQGVAPFPDRCPDTLTAEELASQYDEPVDVPMSAASRLADLLSRPRPDEQTSQPFRRAASSPSSFTDMALDEKPPLFAVTSSPPMGRCAASRPGHPEWLQTSATGTTTCINFPHSQTYSQDLAHSAPGAVHLTRSPEYAPDFNMCRSQEGLMHGACASSSSQSPSPNLPRHNPGWQYLSSKPEFAGGFPTCHQPQQVSRPDKFVCPDITSVPAVSSTAAPGLAAVSSTASQGLSGVSYMGAPGPRAVSSGMMQQTSEQRGLPGHQHIGLNSTDQSIQQSAVQVQQCRVFSSIEQPSLQRQQCRGLNSNEQSSPQWETDPTSNRCQPQPRLWGLPKWSAAAETAEKAHQNMLDGRTEGAAALAPSSTAIPQQPPMTSEFSTHLQHRPSSELLPDNQVTLSAPAAASAAVERIPSHEPQQPQQSRAARRNAMRSANRTVSGVNPPRCDPSSSVCENVQEAVLAETSSSTATACNSNGEIYLDDVDASDCLGIRAPSKLEPPIQMAGGCSVGLESNSRKGPEPLIAQQVQGDCAQAPFSSVHKPIHRDDSSDRPSRAVMRNRLRIQQATASRRAFSVPLQTFVEAAAGEAETPVVAKVATTQISEKAAAPRAWITPPKSWAGDIIMLEDE